MNERNVEIAKKVYELFNRHEWNEMAGLYAAEAEFLDPSFGTSPVTKTRRETAEKYAEMQQMFPDIHDAVQNIYSSGDTVIVEFVSSGNAPDGSRFELPICTIFTVENGLIVRDRTYYDNSQ